MVRLGKQVSLFTQQEVRNAFGSVKIKTRSAGLSVLIAPAQKEYGRILIVTSRRCGNSVQRHLIRRRLKAVFLEEKLYQQPIECIVIVRAEGIATPFLELKHKVLCAVKKYSSL